MPATISDLAARLNLSKGTVSRILNDKGAAFAPATRDRVFAMAEEIGYSANPVARALATGRTGFVALCLHDLLTAYHAQVAHLVESQLEQNGYSIVVTVVGQSPRVPARVERRTVPVGVDGIITHEDRWNGIVGKSRVPVVSTGVYYNPESVDFVGVDIAGVAVDAVRHLVATGRRRIAFLTHNLTDRPGDPRYEAYVTVLRGAGLPLEFIDPPTEDRPVVRAALREYIAAHGHPDALFCHNDEMAIASYRALSDLGLRVPDDVALMGCDGIDDTAYFPAAISTIAQPLAAMCETAWRFLERRMAEPDAPPQRVVLPAELILRESTLGR